MKKLLTDPALYFLGYLIAIVVTFGHVYTHFPPSYTASFSDREIQYGLLEKAIGSVVPSALWPFYWSVQAWK